MTATAKGSPRDFQSRGVPLMVAVLAAVLTDGLPAVEGACAEALAEGVHSASVIPRLRGGRL